MSDLETLLKAGDPAADAGMGPHEVARMRSDVLTALVTPRSRRRRVRIAAAAGIAVVCGTGAWYLRQPAPRAETPGPTATAVAVPAPGIRQQLQFATPGGTRVIWTFDASAESTEVTP